MTIDWFTTGAQVINFLILVYLLKHFLYRPVIDAMSKREALVAARMNDAQALAARAQAQARQHEAKRQELEAAANQLMAAAADQAKAERARLMGALRDEITATRAKWLAELDHERSTRLAGISRALGKEIASTARKILIEIADTPLEQSIVARFMRQLTELSALEQERIATALRSRSEVVIESAFELAPTERAQLLEGLSKVGPIAADVQFSESESLVCGIALTAGSQRWSWTISAYLDELEAAITTTLGQEARSLA